MKRLLYRILAFWRGLKPWEKVVISVCLLVIGSQSYQLVKSFQEPRYIAEGFTWTRFKSGQETWLDGRGFKLTLFRQGLLMQNIEVEETYSLPVEDGWFTYKQRTPFKVSVHSGESVTYATEALEATNNPEGCSDPQVAERSFDCNPAYLKITKVNGERVFVENDRQGSFIVIDDTNARTP